MTVGGDLDARGPTAWPADLDDLERALLTPVAALATIGGTGRARRPAGAGLVADRPGRSTRSSTPSSTAATSTTPPAGCGRGVAGFYTIGSAGHEANALVAAALRPTDPALLHYRSGGFYLARAQQVAGHDGVADVLLGLLASSDEPIAGGRHKVFGHAGPGRHPADVDDRVAPAAGDGRRRSPSAAPGASACRHAGRPTPSPCAASATRRSTTRRRRARSNAAAYTAHQGMALPLLFVCEDNGWGISVPTPAGWVEASLPSRPGLRYERADGTDPVGVFDAAEELADHVRSSSAAGRAAPAHRALRRPRRHRRRGGVPPGRRHPRRPRPRPARWPRPGCSSPPGCATPDALVARYLDGRAARAGAGRRR